MSHDINDILNGSDEDTESIGGTIDLESLLEDLDCEDGSNKLQLSTGKMKVVRSDRVGLSSMRGKTAGNASIPGFEAGNIHSIEKNPDIENEKMGDSILQCLNSAALRQQDAYTLVEKEAESTLQTKMKVDASSESNVSIRCDKVCTISEQLEKNSRFKQHGPGKATCIHTFKDSICIGTSRGLVLLFNHSQVMHQVVGSSVPARCTQPVTSIISVTDSPFIVVGHNNGEIALWDISRVVLVKRLQDIHSSPITRLRSIRLNHPVGTPVNEFFIVSVDFKGVVLKIRFLKSLASYLTGMSFSTECTSILDGGAGPIVEVAYLSPGLEGERVSCHWNKHDQKIIAFNSSFTTLLVTMTPQIEIIYEWPYVHVAGQNASGTSDKALCLDWGWRAINALEKSLNDTSIPVILRSVGASLEMTGCVDPSQPRGRVAYVNFKQRKFDEDIVFCKWLNQSGILALTLNKIYLLTDDLQTIEVLQIFYLNFSDVSGRTDWLKNGLPCIVSFFAGYLHVLDTSSSLQHIYMQPWTQRIDGLIENGRWLEALGVILECSGVRSGREHNLAKVREYITVYVELAMGKSKDRRLESSVVTENNAGLVAGVCIEFCLEANLMDLLFGSLYHQLADANRRTPFFDALVPYIITKKIRDLPSQILRDLLNSYANSGLKSNIELCLVDLHIEKDTDLNQVVKFMVDREMYSGLFHVVFWGGGMDAVGAFAVVHTIFSSATGPVQVEIGHKLLLFIWLSFEMKVFPSTRICEFPVSTIVELIKFTLSDYIGDSKTDIQTYSPLARTALEYTHERHGIVPRVKGSYIGSLLEVDPSASLYCVAEGMKFLIQHEDTSSNVIGDSYADIFRILKKRGNRDDEMLFMNLSRNELLSCDFSLPVDVSCAFIEYIAQLERDRGFHDESMHEAVFSFAMRQSQSREGGAHIRDCLIRSSFLLVSLKIGNEPHSCEVFGHALDFYCEVPSRKIALFVYIEENFRLLGTTIDRRDHGVIPLCKNLARLFGISVDSTKRICCLHLQENIEDIMNYTHDNLSVQFECIDAIVRYTIHCDSRYCVESIMTSGQVDAYLHLVSRFRPRELLHILCSLKSYSAIDVLKFCQEYKIYDATAFLMEKLNMPNPQEVILNHLRTKISQIQKLEDIGKSESKDRTNSGSIRNVEWFDDLSLIIQYAISFSKRKNEDALWFEMFDCISQESSKFTLFLPMIIFPSKIFYTYPLLHSLSRESRRSKIGKSSQCTISRFSGGDATFC
jgi:hypothetical protein